LLAKHFFTYKYDYRDEWLNFTRILSEGEPGSVLCERVIRAMAGLVESPAGALWLRQDNRFVRAAHWNLPAVELDEPADGELAAFLESRGWVIALDEYRADPAAYGELKLGPRFSDNPEAWLIVPLLFHDRLLGFLLLAKSLGKVSFNWEVWDLLKTAARQAASHLAQMQAADALVVARQFDSFNRMTAFVVHDLKNLVAQLSLLTENAEKHKNNPEFIEDMIATVESSVARMNRLLMQLRSGGHEENIASDVDLYDVVKDVVAAKNAFRLKPVVMCAEPAIQVRADRLRLARALGNVVQNALEATRYDGVVTIDIRRDGNAAVVEVKDSGRGMDETFVRERLFRPFDSTKGSGMGIGAYECREYARELGGGVEVESEPGAGTRFSIRLPAVPPQPVRQGAVA
jgi:putative PEP-CTERM system histidine kinase